MTSFELSRTLAELKRNEKYDEALQLFRQEKNSLTPEKIAGNFYIVADMLTILRKAGHPRAAFAFLREYGVEIGTDTPERILLAYGWVVYDLYKRDNEAGRFNPHTFLEQLRHIVPLLERYDTPYTKSVLSALLRIVSKVEKSRSSVSWEYLLEITALFDPAKLSTECTTITGERRGRQQAVELASGLENWYALRSKALIETKRFHEALEISREALQRLEMFHFSNDYWFARRIALAYEALGESEEAIRILEQILSHRKEWFIQWKLAELHYRAGKQEEAFDYAMAAITGPGKLPYKVGLLELIGDMLMQRSQERMALAHYRLAHRVRQSQGWKVSHELTGKCRWERQENFPTQKELNVYWHECLRERLPHGHIVRILHDNERGMDGFLVSAGESYYFRLPAGHRLREEIVESMEVIFEPVIGRNERLSARIVGYVPREEAA